MLVIRFLRTGKKNQPFFRIVVTDKRNPPRAGRFLEILGFFNPLTKRRNLKKERIKYWLSVGAKPSARVHNLLVEEKITEAEKIDVHKKKKTSPDESKSIEGESAKTKPAEDKSTESKPLSKPLEDKKDKSTPTETVPTEIPAVKEETVKEETAKEEAPKEEKPKQEVEIPKKEEEKPKETNNNT